MKIGLGKEKSERRFKDGVTSSIDIDLNHKYFSNSPIVSFKKISAPLYPSTCDLEILYFFLAPSVIITTVRMGYGMDVRPTPRRPVDDVLR